MTSEEILRDRRRGDEDLSGERRFGNNGFVGLVRPVLDRSSSAPFSVRVGSTGRDMPTASNASRAERN
jgi:hypothetical protein